MSGEDGAHHGREAAVYAARIEHGVVVLAASIREVGFAHGAPLDTTPVS